MTHFGVSRDVTKNCKEKKEEIILNNCKLQEEKTYLKNNRKCRLHVSWYLQRRCKTLQGKREDIPNDCNILHEERK